MLGLGRRKWKVSSFAQSEVKLPQAKHEHVINKLKIVVAVSNKKFKTSDKKSGDKILNTLLMLCIVVKKMVKEEKHLTHTRIYDKRSLYSY